MPPRRWVLTAAIFLVAASPTGVAGAQEAEPPPTCTAVAHLGDSTSVMMRQPLRAAYAEQGWTDVVIDAGGGRGVFHKVGADVSGLRAVERIRATGFTGCWVVALGINDVLNLDEGDRHTVEQTVGALLDAIGAAPVLWATVHLPRHAATAARLNAAIGADGRAVVFDWDTVVSADPTLQLPDLVHYTSRGSLTYAAGLAAASVALRGLEVPEVAVPAETAPAAAAVTAAPTRGLARASFRYGSLHRDVARLQRALRRAGLDVGDREDGRFGPRTYLAVRAFNHHAGLPGGGVVTATTATALGLAG